MMTSFDAAVADYLHRTEHERPWTRGQEEALLNGLAGWLRTAAEGVPLAAVTPQVVAAYAFERGLDRDELDDLRGTVAGLRCWMRRAVPAD